MASRRIYSWLNRLSTVRIRRYQLQPKFDRLETRELLTNLPPGFSETILATGINAPTAMDFAPDGRLFVDQQEGNVRVIKNGQLLSTPFLTLNNVDFEGERGLLGIAFDPNFATNQFVYVYYTVAGSPAHNRVSRFTANGDVAVPGSEVDIFDIDPLSSDTRHNGGAIHFGPDGDLYIGVGDNKVGANAQSLSSLMGKMLRIRPDGTIPTDNPFYNQTTGVDRAIWALGLRNPFTFAFGTDAMGNERMFINDVGENTWEEIDDGIAGANYGWSGGNTDGFGQTPTGPGIYHDPLMAYNHVGGPAGGGIAITGGAFYDPTTTQFPSSYVGKYFYQDLSGNFMRVFDPANPGSASNPDTSSAFATSLPSTPVDIKVDSAGSLFYLAGAGTANGEVVRIDFTPPPPPPPPVPPVILQQPTSLTVFVGQSATFTVVAQGSGNTFQWQRDGRNIPGAVAPIYVLPAATASDNGAQFSVMVTRTGITIGSDVATLTVKMVLPPIPVITTPPVGSLYIAGQTIGFSGGATDPQDGVLPASALVWQVDQHDTNGVHQIVPPTAGIASGSFAIPQQGDLSLSVIYRITLTATDAEGLSRSTFVDVAPHTAHLGLMSLPAGLPINLDGQAQSTPAIITGVSGMIRTLQAPSSEIVGGVIYQFIGWSDGITAAARSLPFPSVDTTLISVYQAVGIVPYVTIQNPREHVLRGRVQSISLDFKGPIDPPGARNRTDYWLVLPGPDRKFGTRDDRRLRFRSVTFSAATNSVTLRPSIRLSPRQVFQVIAVASGTRGLLTDIYGRPIDGNRDGQPGGDFVATFGPGASVVSFASRQQFTQARPRGG
jgi:glucose/arabinose dehydrogenase